MTRFFRSKHLTTIILTLSLILFGSNQVMAQSSWLNNVSAILNDMTPGAHAELNVSFTLPYEASPIRHSDYIHISPAFEITASTAVLGGAYSGIPTYTVTESSFRVNNIAVAAGNRLSIYNIHVNNPLYDGWWPVTITITQDEAGTIVKNRATVTATRIPGTVSVSALIDTPFSRLSISGISGPETYVTFVEGGSVIGTGLSGLDGYFGKLFPNMEPGNHQITFFGTDKERLVTTPITISLYIPSFQETSVTNQILSPTISLDKSTYNPGDNIIASGSAVPNGDITLLTQSPLRSYSTTADNEGNWLYTITNSAEYVAGDYHIYSLVQNNGLTSLNSPSIGFSITTTGSVGTPCGDVYQGDLNCDDNIDLTDFSILMYYWGTNNAIADINGDLYVNLVDFSVMMYWWGT